MAMIQCPECGQMVSDQSANCVHCGFPLRTSGSVLIIEFGKAPRVITQLAIFVNGAQRDVCKRKHPVTITTDGAAGIGIEPVSITGTSGNKGCVYNLGAGEHRKIVISMGALGGWKINELPFG